LFSWLKYSNLIKSNAITFKIIDNKKFIDLSSNNTLIEIEFEVDVNKLSVI